LGTNLDANIVKAIAYQESRMGYYNGNLSGAIDVMQTLTDANPAIHRLAAVGDYDPNEGSMPKNGYGLFKLLYPNGRRDNSAMTVEMSFAGGIRWLIHKGTPARYNGGGDSNYESKINNILNNEMV